MRRTEFRTYLTWMSTLRFTAGVGVSFSGACGLPLVWRAGKPLHCALRPSATPNGVQPAPQSTISAAFVGHATVLKHHTLGLGLCLSLQWMQRERERKREKRVCTQNTARRHKRGVLNRSDRNFREAFSVYLSFLLARVALKLRPLTPLRIHPSRLCRFAVF